MADKPPLVARWGGSPPPTHPPLVITKPASSQSDLTLTSEVLVQGFLSLQRHRYTYRVNNGLKNHVLRVDWKGPGIKIDRAAKNETVISQESFFSPQVLKTTASAEAIADETPFAGRPSQDARADAYVPWTAAIAKSLKEILGEAIAKKLTLKTAASVAIAGGATVSVTSQLARANGQFEYKLVLENLGVTPLSLDIAGLRFENEAVEFKLAPAKRKELRHVSSDEPVERQVMLKIAGECEVPIFVMVADSMVETTDKVKNSSKPVDRRIQIKKTVLEKKKKKKKEEREPVSAD
jgi:hypothetical protein